MDFTPPAPEDIPDTWKTEVDKWMTYHVDLSLIFMYAHGDVPASDLQEIIKLAKDTYIRTVLHHEKYYTDFMAPAPGLDSLRHKTIPELLEHHILNQDKGWTPSDGNNQGELEWYPFLFVVVGSEWRSQGVLVVHIKTGKRGCKVDSCMLKAHTLGMPLTSLVMGDEGFGAVKQGSLDGSWEME